MAISDENLKAAHKAARDNYLAGSPENAYKLRVQSVYVEAKCKQVEGKFYIFLDASHLVSKGPAKSENEAWRNAWFNLID